MNTWTQSHLREETRNIALLFCRFETAVDLTTFNLFATKGGKIRGEVTETRRRSAAAALKTEARCLFFNKQHFPPLLLSSYPLIADCFTGTEQLQRFWTRTNRTHRQMNEGQRRKGSVRYGEEGEVEEDQQGCGLAAGEVSLW